MCFSRAGRPLLMECCSRRSVTCAAYVELLREQNVLYLDGLLKTRLRPRAGGLTAVAISMKRCRYAYLTGYRARSRTASSAAKSLLLKQTSCKSGAAEKLFQLPTLLSRSGKARIAFESACALSLAKLYQSTARSPPKPTPVLAPALDDFAPTPEMLEIAEAQAMFAALAETDEVKVEAAHRQRLTQLHAAYGNALIGTHGYGAPETSTGVFARARESASGDKDAPGALVSRLRLMGRQRGRSFLDAGRPRRARQTRASSRRRRSSRRHWLRAEATTGPTWLFARSIAPSPCPSEPDWLVRSRNPPRARRNPSRSATGATRLPLRKHSLPRSPSRKPRRRAASRIARGAGVGQALSIDRPPRRRPRYRAFETWSYVSCRRQADIADDVS